MKTEKEIKQKIKDIKTMNIRTPFNNESFKKHLTSLLEWTIKK